MIYTSEFEILLTTPPGLEQWLLKEVQEAGFKTSGRRAGRGDNLGRLDGCLAG